MDNELLIMSTAGLTMLTSEVRQVASKHQAPTMKPIIAGFMMGLFLFIANAVSPQVTHVLCILIIIGSLLLNGKPLFDLMGGAK